MIDTAQRNKQPLNESPYAPLPLGAVRLTGLGGQIGEKVLQVFTEAIDAQQGVFCQDSAWLGGGVYAPEMSAQLLALAQAACAFDDQTLWAHLRRYMRWCIDTANPDGPFGPEKADLYDHALACRALAHYYTSSGDQKALKVMAQYFYHLFQHLEDTPFSLRDQALVCELVGPMLWLFNLTGYPFLRRLCAQISRLSQNWTGHFTAFHHTRDLKQTLPDAQRDPYNRAYYMTDGVSNALALKYPALLYAFLGGNQNADASKAGLEKLTLYHGQPQGLFSCDAHLSGTHPSAAVSTQAITAAMDSLTLLCAQRGESLFADALERLAFNALPGAFTPDLKSVQPYSCANQVCTVPMGHRFYNAAQDALVFAPTPVQALSGLFSYIQAIAMKSENGLAILSYPDAQITWVINGTPVRIRMEGGYPAGDTVRITVRPKHPLNFALRLRIPSWAKDAILTDETGETPAASDEFFVLDRMWEGSVALSLHLPKSISIEHGYRQSVSLYAGPLLMALPLSENLQKQFNGRFAVTTDQSWAYALCAPQEARIAYQEGSGRFKDGSCISATITAVPVSWPNQGSDAGAPPVLPDAVGPQTQLTLRPFGDTTLRISRFPLCREP